MDTFHAQTLERFLGSAAPILRSVRETTVTEVRRIAEADRTAQGGAKAASRNAADLPTGEVNLTAVAPGYQERLRLESRQRELARRAHELQAMLDTETEAASHERDDPRSYQSTLLARLSEIRADQVQIENILQHIRS